MIIVYHHQHRVTAVKHGNSYSRESVGQSAAKTLLQLASENQNEILVWCAQEFASDLNEHAITNVLHHNKMMLSYTVEQQSYLGRKMGYVEESPFLNVPKKVRYPTWMMSSTVGAIHASALHILSSVVPTKGSLDYFLNSVAKIGMMNGLFCYAEPQLLHDRESRAKMTTANNLILFRFVRQHYKKRWLFLLLLNLIVFEKQFPFLPFLLSWLYRSRRSKAVDFETLIVQSTKKVVLQKSIDVILPTIGRKEYLHDVLNDLALQTHLPKNVIIVEQNPQEDSSSELDFIQSKSWPFQIKHTFTHQAGACNARNLALSQVSSEWVFLNDDDNRFGADLLEQVFTKLAQYGTEALTTAYLQPNEIQRYGIIHQTGIFGSGNSFVKTTALQNIRFDAALEFGYGEDTDFGMQLRQSGTDIIYFPSLHITHLKAPMGGFRTKLKQLWDDEKMQPKPSPTIMYVFLKHYTLEQLQCYKLVSFFKLLRKERVYKWYYFRKEFEIKWKLSQDWAIKL